MRCLFAILVILLFPLWLIADVRSDEKAGEGANRLTPAGPAIVSGISSAEGLDRRNDSGILGLSNDFESIPNSELSLRLFVTPEDPSIQTLAVQTNGAGDAYEIAAQWIYVSDEVLNHTIDKWLTPHEFLTNTPDYSSNPLQGKAVSDCEEKANALVSLIRAKGIFPEEVRVVLGEVAFNNIKTGHAWIELLIDGRWLVLDPSWGPYWDDRVEKLINRRSNPFDYYARHTYPVVQVWAYYNDIYYQNPKSGLGNAPDSWRITAPFK